MFNMNLIANSGIQLYTIPININLTDNFKMYFYEWFDDVDFQLKLEIAHKFSSEEGDIWVKKRTIYDFLGLGVSNGKVGRMEGSVFKPYKWEEIKKEFFEFGNKTITPMESEETGTDCFELNTSRCKWEIFENRWLPFPLFVLGNNGKSKFGPTNWCRCKLIPDSSDKNTKKYNLLLAFDTRTKFEKDNFQDEDLLEMPVFTNDFDPFKKYALCDNEFFLVDFCSEDQYKCGWVDEYILNIFHKTKNIGDLKIIKPKMNYLAQYIFLLKYIQQLNILPTIALFSDKNENHGEVDLVVDMGNSRTCAVLFDNHDYKKVDLLGLQNFINPIVKGKLNKPEVTFEMRMAFRKVDFDVSTLVGSSQFVYPSAVRLGAEANELIHKAVDFNLGLDKITTFSSPKRYLWDDKPQQKEWKFITLKGEENLNTLIQIKGITDQLNADGSLNSSGSGGFDKFYSRKALMTFAFLEILTQARMQMNSYEFRHKWGEENKKRRLGRIIVTCPPGMSKIEQIALRKCCEDAAILLDRFYSSEKSNFNELSNIKIQIVPEIKNLRNRENRNEWIYDEATCPQFVYLFAELTKRYRNNSVEYFDFYGKVRNDLGDYNKKSITIGSVDIGAGTTDLMIAAYKYDDASECTLTPVPLFWESFYIAGDDLLKNLIRKMIIDGENAIIPKKLRDNGITDANKLILDFFGKDNARQTVTDRKMRADFNLQVAVPVVSHFLELLNEFKLDEKNITYNEIFYANQPSEHVQNHFKKHFGFAISDLIWHFNKVTVSKIVESTFNTLTSKISTVISYYGCDFVLLSGRPSSLKPLSDLFLRYYAVSPNRLVTLNSYRIGTWYPFQDGNGYFKDAKSIVAVGAMIGNFASTKGGLDGFTLNLKELAENMVPTSDYFTKSEYEEQAFISPDIKQASLEVTQIPFRIWTRQLNSSKYPTRPFYIFDFNREKIKKRLINIKGDMLIDNASLSYAVDNEINRLKQLMPFKLTIIRENFMDDKELLLVESIRCKNQEDLSTANFLLQIQSMTESDSYWLDSGEFANLI